MRNRLPTPAKTPADRPLRYASYCRCSSDDQAEGDFSTIQVQQNLNRAYVQKAGGTLVAELIDEGKTGTNLERAGWRKLIALASKREIDVVVVTYMSRLARGDAYNAAEYLLREKRVRVEMVEESFTDDLAGRMQKRTKNFIDGLYADQVSQWTRTKQAKMVEMGYYTGGTRPYGYAIEPIPGMEATPLAGGKVKPPPKRLVPHPAEAEHVRHAFQLFLATRSIAHVQRYLRSVDTTRNWPMSAVRSFLAADRYRGVSRFGENVNPSAHEALISEHVFDSVQELLADRESQLPAAALGHHAPRATNAAGDALEPLPYYLRGLVFCGHCGGRMTPSQASGRLGRVPYYECIGATKKGAGCPAKRVNANSLHEAVLEEILRCALHPSRLSRLWEASVKNTPLPTEAKDELAKLRRNLRETQKKQGRVVEAIKQVGALPALTEEVRSLEELAASQQAKISELESSQVRRTMSRPDAAKVAANWSRLLEFWEVLDHSERSMLLGLIVNRIEVNDKSKGTTWLCLAAHQEAPHVNPLFSQGEDARFANREVYSAEVAPYLRNRASANNALASFLSIPPTSRRRRGNDHNALCERIRLRLARQSAGELATR